MALKMMKTPKSRASVADMEDAQFRRDAFLQGQGLTARPATDSVARTISARFNTHNPTAVNDPMSYLRAAGWDVGAGYGAGATATLPQGTDISATTRQGWWGTGGTDGQRGGMAPVKQGGFIGRAVQGMSQYANSRGPANFYQMLQQPLNHPNLGGISPANGLQGAPLGTVDARGRYSSNLYGQMVGAGYTGGRNAGYQYGGLGNIAGKVKNDFDRANADNWARYNAALSEQQAGGQRLEQMAAQGGQGANAALNKRLAAETGAINQRVAARGLGNSTVGEQLRRGVNADADVTRAQIADQVNSRVLGVAQNNLNTRLRLLEAPTVQGPDANLYAQLLARAGARGEMPEEYLPEYPEVNPPRQQNQQGGLQINSDAPRGQAPELPRGFGGDAPTAREDGGSFDLPQRMGEKPYPPGATGKPASEPFDSNELQGNIEADETQVSGIQEKKLWAASFSDEDRNRLSYDERGRLWVWSEELGKWNPV
jgi:hypothetical protein